MTKMTVVAAGAALSLALMLPGVSAEVMTVSKPH